MHQIVLITVMFDFHQPSLAHIYLSETSHYLYMLLLIFVKNVKN